jgi:predicted anti-sigma-YlaC factor YlaD
MNCSEVEKNLIFYLEGPLSADEVDKISSHLENCSKCTKLVYSINSSLSIIEDQKNLKPSPFLYTRIAAKLQNEIERVPYYRKRILQPLFIACIAVFALIGGIKIGSIYKSARTAEMASITTDYWNDMSQEPIESKILKGE